MIPARILEFLERANVGHAGTRDRDRVPHGHRVSGWIANAGAGTLTVLIPETARPHLIESLEDNGQIAVTTDEYPAHEAYQFKGRYVRHRGVSPQDLEIANRTRERFLKALTQFFGEEAVVPVRAFVQQPSIAVEFEVLEIFVQTPGPGAGARLVPEP